MTSEEWIEIREAGRAGGEAAGSLRVNSAGSPLAVASILMQQLLLESRKFVHVSGSDGHVEVMDLETGVPIYPPEADEPRILQGFSAVHIFASFGDPRVFTGQPAIEGFLDAFREVAGVGIGETTCKWATRICPPERRALVKALAPSPLEVMLKIEYDVPRWRWSLQRSFDRIGARLQGSWGRWLPGFPMIRVLLASFFISVYQMLDWRWLEHVCGRAAQGMLSWFGHSAVLWYSSEHVVLAVSKTWMRIDPTCTLVDISLLGVLFGWNRWASLLNNVARSAMLVMLTFGANVCRIAFTAVWLAEGHKWFWAHDIPYVLLCCLLFAVVLSPFIVEYRRVARHASSCVVR